MLKELDKITRLDFKTIQCFFFRFVPPWILWKPSQEGIKFTVHTHTHARTPKAQLSSDKESLLFKRKKTPLLFILSGRERNPFLGKSTQLIQQKRMKKRLKSKQYQTQDCKREEECSLSSRLQVKKLDEQIEKLWIGEKEVT